MRHLAVICMLLALPSATIAADMTHEETVVRTTYAKLAYAARMGVLLRNAKEARMGSESAFDDELRLKQEMDSQLTFEFQSVNVGNLADIAETRWDTLVTKPQLDLLTVSFVYFHEPIKVGGTEPISEMSYVRATWQRWDDHVWIGVSQ